MEIHGQIIIHSNDQDLFYPQWHKSVLNSDTFPPVASLETGNYWVSGEIALFDHCKHRTSKFPEETFHCSGEGGDVNTVPPPEFHNDTDN